MGRSKEEYAGGGKFLKKGICLFVCPGKKPMKLEPSEKKGEYCDIWHVLGEENSSDHLGLCSMINNLDIILIAMEGTN